MNQTSTLPKVSLHYQDSRSDKVYHLQIESKDGEFIVSAAYGRRGSTLATALKPSDGKAVPFDKARKIYNAVLKEKLAKGYSEIAGQAAFSGTSNAGRISNLLPQLLNEIDEASFLKLILDDSYFFQEKKDGKRVMIRSRDGKTEAINRRGLTIGFPKEVENELSLIEGNFILDGEMIGDVFWVFDILATPNDPDVARLGAEPRYRVLKTFVSSLDDASSAPLSHVQLVTAAFTTREKEEMYKTLVILEVEGIVVKLKSAPYTPGKPASGGPQLKRKFYETATVRVARVNVQRSILVEVLGDDSATWIPVGNVSIPVSKDIPAVGSLAEVRYLYAYKGGSLIQPSFLGTRDDVVENDCSISQLKYKTS